MVLALWVGARAQEEPVVEVSEGARTVGFTPPPNCQKLSEEAKALVSKEILNLKYGCATPQKDTVLFLIMPPDTGDEKGLAYYEKDFKKSQNTLHPNIKWLGRDTVKIGGDKWVRLRFREGPAENNLINHAYFTDWAGRFVLFIVGSPASQYERLKAGLEKSAKSIQLTIFVNAPVNADTPGVKDKP